MEKIIEEILSQKNNIIKYGELNEKLLMELKMTTSLYDYIQVVNNYYDDDEMPNVNNWTDVEGMGYGWAWLNYEEKDWHKMMSKLVHHETNSLLSNINNTFYVVYEEEYENQKTKVYHFVSLGHYREDILISFSNTEIEF